MAAPGDEPIRLVPYDSAWRRLFEIERELLNHLLGPWLVGAIEHIGSTAVPGLAAKPIIDLMAGVETLDASRPAIAALQSANYLYAPYRADVEHWFCKPNPARRTHHLHLIPYKSRLWTECLTFRDSLRSDPSIAQQYLVLKQRLAAAHETDREAYTDGKAEFIAAVLQRAMPP